MRFPLFISLLILSLSINSCGAQNKNTMNNNPLMCDPDSGICEIPTANFDGMIAVNPTVNKPVTIIYFTDPICSSCWGIEPQLRKLKLEYGDALAIDYRMGGLLKDWSYNSGGISKPSDVAHHWDEVSAYYKMPIDGDVWLTDPLNSSYPPSIAFKAAQMQDKVKAVKFMRILREMVFLEKKNITKWEHISAAADKTGLDVALLKKNFENDAEALFREDLALAAKMGVRGFPSVFISNANGGQEFVYGFKPYEVYESAISKLFPILKKNEYDKTWQFLFSKYPTLTTREFAELKNVSISESEIALENLVEKKELTKFMTKNGPLWKK